MNNELIEALLVNLIVNKERIPVAFAFYDGHGEPYVTYQQIDSDRDFSADDDLLNFVDYFDVDIYSKTNYREIQREIMKRMKTGGFIFQPDRSGGDMYEVETGYYHKTLNFALIRGTNNNGEDWT